MGRVSAGTPVDYRWAGCYKGYTEQNHPGVRFQVSLGETAQSQEVGPTAGNTAGVGNWERTATRNFYPDGKQEHTQGKRTAAQRS